MCFEKINLFILFIRVSFSSFHNRFIIRRKQNISNALLLDSFVTYCCNRKLHYLNTWLGKMHLKYHIECSALSVCGLTGLTELFYFISKMKSIHLLVAIKCKSNQWIYKLSEASTQLTYTLHFSYYSQMPIVLLC